MSTSTLIVFVVRFEGAEQPKVVIKIDMCSAAELNLGIPSRMLASGAALQSSFVSS